MVIYSGKWSMRTLNICATYIFKSNALACCVTIWNFSWIVINKSSSFATICFDIDIYISIWYFSRISMNECTNISFWLNIIFVICSKCSWVVNAIALNKGFKYRTVIVDYKSCCQIIIWYFWCICNANFIYIRACDCTIIVDCNTTNLIRPCYNKWINRQVSICIFTTNYICSLFRLRVDCRVFEHNLTCWVDIINDTYIWVCNTTIICVCRNQSTNLMIVWFVCSNI